MNRRVISIAAVVSCVLLLFPVCVYAQDTCYTRFSRLSVNELVRDDRSFDLAYSKTNYLKRIDAVLAGDTKLTFSISGKKLRICVADSSLKSVRPFGFSSVMNRAFASKNGIASRTLSLSALKIGFYSVGIYILYKGGTTNSFRFYLEKTSRDIFLYSPGQYYNDELIDSASSWYKAVGRETVNAAYTANADPQITRKTDELTASCSDDAEKAESIYKWIIKNIRYDYEYSVYDPVICFREKRGVCNAIAQLYTVMCNCAGIPCLLVYGESIDAPLAAEKTSTVQNHAWVLIYTDGQWRYCDPTWDVGDPARREYYMISSTQAGIDHIAYSVFVPDPVSNTALYFHEWGISSVDVPATDTKNGIATYTCRKCGITKKVILPAAKKGR